MAGSATITGTQNYVMGIGHPKTEATTEAHPAVVETDPLTGRNGLVVNGASTPLAQQGQAIGLIGDSLLYYGIVPGALVAAAPAIAGLNPFNASLDCSVATTGTLEFQASTRSVRFTAPGDTAGAWVAVTKAMRATISSGTAAMTLDLSILPDLLPAIDSTSTLTLSPNPAYTAITWRNVPSWIEVFTGQRTQFVNACIPGAQIAHLSDNIDDLITRATAANLVLTEVWIQCGTNDVASGTTPVSATLLSTYGAAITKAANLGLKVRVLSLPMRSLTAASAAQIGWREINKGLPSLAKTYGASFHDIWQHTQDPASATAPATGMTTDNVHPSGPAAFIAGVKLYNQIAGDLAGGQSPFLISAVDAYNASTNPTGNLLPGTPVGSAGTAGAGGTATDLATTWDVRRNSGAITIVGTKQASLDGGPAWQRLTFGAAAAITDEAKYEYNLGVGVTTVNAGDTVEAYAEVNIPAQTGLRRLSIWMTTVGAARNDSTIFDTFDTSATFIALPAVAWPGTPVIRLPRFKIPASTTSLRFRVFANTEVGATPIVDIRSISLRKVV